MRKQIQRANRAQIAGHNMSLEKNRMVDTRNKMVQRNAVITPQCKRSQYQYQSSRILFIPMSTERDISRDGLRLTWPRSGVAGACQRKIQFDADCKLRTSAGGGINHANMTNGEYTIH
jgi:hypothetical protein